MINPDTKATTTNVTGEEEWTQANRKGPKAPHIEKSTLQPDKTLPTSPSSILQSCLLENKEILLI